MSYQAQTQTKREAFLLMLSEIHRRNNLSRHTIMTILILCKTDQQMKRFEDWVVSRMPETDPLPYDENALIAVANDAHNNRTIRKLRQDKA